jgi:hypothetical protein
MFEHLEEQKVDLLSQSSTLANIIPVPFFAARIEFTIGINMG